jgi:quercetin dioxygenase-like cupin family protein
MYFYDESDMTARTIAPGVDIRVVSGEKAQMSFVTLQPGSQVPMHSHPHEQMGMVLEGEFEFTIGEERRLVRKGDTYVIPGGIIHGVTRVEKRAVALDIFSPPREEYR